MTTLALMDHSVAGVLFLIAVGLFVVGAILALTKHAVYTVALIAAGLAFFAFPFMWDRFSLA